MASNKYITLKALSIAWMEIGKGEIGRNNDGPHVLKYTRGKVRSWCACFTSWCWEQAGIQLGIPAEKIPAWCPGAKGFVRKVAKLGRSIDVKKEDPTPGDMIAWHRKEPGAPVFKITWRGHIGFVFGYEKTTDTLITIEGNSGKFPARVKLKFYPNGKWRRRLYKVARYAE